MKIFPVYQRGAHYVLRTQRYVCELRDWGISVTLLKFMIEARNCLLDFPLLCLGHLRWYKIDLHVSPY